MPLSYAQYAGNGSTTTFSVPFPYLLKAHVKLYTGYNILTGAFTSQLVEGTNYTWTSGTQVQTTVAPANGVTLTVLRDTPDSSQLVPWQDGSNLVADDLNNADLQNLYVVQEQQDRNDAGAAAAVAAQTAANTAAAAATAATTAANTATTTAAAATTAANAATAAATASTAASAQATADSQTALTQSAQAVATANTASTNSSSALSTANASASSATTALSNSQTALTQSSNAVTTANQSSTAAGTALTNSQTALTQSSQAVSTANTSAASAATALSNSQTALTQSGQAVTTANSANSKADQAIAAVGNSVLYQLVANVAAIPGSPANNKAVEIYDSTGIESFAPLAGRPAGFAGSSGLSVRIIYSSTGSTWNWVQYFPNDPETRYLKFSGGTLTGQLRGDDSASPSTPGFAFDGDPDTGIGRLGANELGLITGGVVRLSFDSSGAASFTNSVTIPAGSTVTGYLDTATAASTYQTQAGMSSYLTTTAAGTTYAPLASPTFTGTVTIPAGASIAGYLTTATASSTYQTQAGMSSYLTTAAASSTYAPQASPTFTGAIYANGSYRGNITAVAALNIDCSLGNLFTKTINGNSTFTVSNVPASRSYAFTLELTHTSGTITWFSGVVWPGGTAPTLTTGKVHLFMFFTDDGGTTWRASSLTNY